MRTDYEHLAARYDQDRAQFAVPPDDVIDELLRSRPAISALDVGCGTGRWLAAQRELFDESRVTLLGADPSAAMLAVARTKGVDHLVQARAEDLPFKNASLDYVVTSYVFHHVEDKDRALDEVRRLLKAAGTFRLENIEPAAADGEWLYEFFPEAVAIDAVRFWPADRIADALSARGFAVDVSREAGHEELAAADALAMAERRVVSQLAVLDDVAYAAGLARLRRVAARPDATVATTRTRLCLTARRR